MPYKKRQRFTLREHLGPFLFFCGVHVAHLFGYLICLFVIVPSGFSNGREDNYISLVKRTMNLQVDILIVTRKIGNDEYG
jgi:hypothetical protein